MIVKEEQKREAIELVNSAIDGDWLICNLQVFWDEEPIDDVVIESFGEMNIERRCRYQYKTFGLQYAIPRDTKDIRAYLKAHLADIRAYVLAQVKADNQLVRKIPQTILDEWKAADTVPELKAVLGKILKRLL